MTFFERLYLGLLAIAGNASVPGDLLYKQPGPIGVASPSPRASEILLGHGASLPGYPVRLRRMS